MKLPCYIDLNEARALLSEMGVDHIELNRPGFAGGSNS